MNHVKKMLKILKIIKYGLIYENVKYNIIGLVYNEYIKEYVFIDDNDGYFCLCDLDKFLVPNSW